MRFALTAAGAGVAVLVEMLEALAIVVAVGASRRWRDAFIGAAAAVAVCALLALAVGPLLLARLPLAPLRVVVGVALLLFGLEWLRKGTLRLAGRRSRSSALGEYLEVREELEAVPLPAPGQADWAGRVVAFKGVLLEGVEVILIVSVLAARPGGLAPALTGSAVALVLIVLAGARLRPTLERVPETELKYGVGVLLTAFGIFFLAEGLGAEWPGGDLALIYLAGVLLAVTQLHASALAHIPSHR